MPSLSYSRKNRKLPDVVVIPIDYGKPRKNAGYFEKMVFYRDTSREGRLLVVSRDIVKKAGGFNPTLGFGEDRLFQEKIFKLVNVDEKTRKRFKI